MCLVVWSYVCHVTLLDILAWLSCCGYCLFEITIDINKSDERGWGVLLIYSPPFAKQPIQFSTPVECEPESFDVDFDLEFMNPAAFRAAWRRSRWCSFTEWIGSLPVRTLICHLTYCIAFQFQTIFIFCAQEKSSNTMDMAEIELYLWIWNERVWNERSSLKIVVHINL